MKKETRFEGLSHGRKVCEQRKRPSRLCAGLQTHCSVSEHAMNQCGHCCLFAPQWQRTAVTERKVIISPSKNKNEQKNKRTEEANCVIISFINGRGVDFQQQWRLFHLEKKKEQKEQKGRKEGRRKTWKTQRPFLLLTLCNLSVLPLCLWRNLLGPFVQEGSFVSFNGSVCCDFPCERWTSTLCFYGLWKGLALPFTSLERSP